MIFQAKMRKVWKQKMDVMRSASKVCKIETAVLKRQISTTIICDRRLLTIAMEVKKQAAFDDQNATFVYY